ncbi:hypothetical protein MSAN_00051500 [Mycena sanguinolenta]|uniref:Uncharacterized protein n=1 Tax=Mycena sanguinolenta TaxID=230812 RepID=A0A8H7DJB4_9AGAR|nr:hypothetical protein MSAN_00051500 [Mycena sanguinolenta]
MIRRTPTLIIMSDLDVQDVRDVVAKQKTDSALMLKMKRMAENPAMDNEDMEMLDQLKARYGDREKRGDAGGSTTGGAN